MKRRDFLKFLGGIGALGVLPGVGTSLAMAEGDAPKRFLLLSHCHGWPYESWRMHPPGTSRDVSQKWMLESFDESEWSQALRPLYRHRQRLNVLDGLSLASAELDLDGNRHDTGWVHAWTGGKADFSGTDTRSTVASIDQIIARQISRDDRLPSLELALNDARETGRPIAYSPAGIRLPVETDPARIWSRVFGPANAPDPLAVRRQGVLGYAYQEFQRISQRVSPVHRAKLEAHFELVDGLGARLEGMANLSCESVPGIPQVGADYGERFDLVADLIAASLGCDATRVVSLSLGEMPTNYFGWDHLTEDVHKGLAHDIYDDPQKYQAMSDYVEVHARQVARLVDRLSEIPDVDGRSVMDNTLIVWGSELADGWHGYEHYCPVIIGGDWHFETGNYHYWPHETPIDILTRTGYASACGKPHQHLLVSLAQAMGLDVDAVGLEHLISQQGGVIDTRGPLEGLRA